MGKYNVKIKEDLEPATRENLIDCINDTNESLKHEINDMPVFLFGEERNQGSFYNLIYLSAVKQRQLLLAEAPPQYVHDKQKFSPGLVRKLNKMHKNRAHITEEDARRIVEYLIEQVKKVETGALSEYLDRVYQEVDARKVIKKPNVFELYHEKNEKNKYIYLMQNLKDDSLSGVMYVKDALKQLDDISAAKSAQLMDPVFAKSYDGTIANLDQSLAQFHSNQTKFELRKASLLQGDYEARMLEINADTMLQADIDLETITYEINEITQKFFQYLLREVIIFFPEHELHSRLKKDLQHLIFKNKDQVFSTLDTLHASQLITPEEKIFRFMQVILNLKDQKGIDDIRNKYFFINDEPLHIHFLSNIAQPHSYRNETSKIFGAIMATEASHSEIFKLFSKAAKAQTVPLAQLYAIAKEADKLVLMCQKNRFNFLDKNLKTQVKHDMPLLLKLRDFYHGGSSLGELNVTVQQSVRAHFSG